MIPRSLPARLLAGLVLAVGLPAAALAQFPEEGPIVELDWQETPGSYALPATNSRYELSHEEILLVGSEARDFMDLSQGVTGWDDVEAVVYTVEGRGRDSWLTVEYYDIGYVRDDDWQELDSDQIYNELLAATEASNEERRANGYPTLELTGWVEYPYYDEASDTAYWALKAVDSAGEETVNAVALKLGRHGYSAITWVGEPRQFTRAEETLRPAIRNYSFDDGFRYADFREGDVVAAVGLGTLAYAMATGNKTTKAAAAGIFAVIAALAKKFWFLLLAPFVFLGKLFRRS